MKKRICDVIEDGQVVFRGTYVEIADFLGTTKKAVRTGANYKRKFKSKYWVVYSGWRIEEIKKKEVVKKPEVRKPTKFEAKLDYMIRHLNEYGNTVTNTNPEPYLQELVNRGYLVGFRKVRDNKHHDSLIASTSRGKQQYFYVITLHNCVPKQENNIIRMYKWRGGSLGL